MNRLDWKLFIDKPNPVASALMARMNFLPEERPRVKLHCLRLLATLSLEPRKTALISRFVDNYLCLQAQEVRDFREELENIPEMEKQAIMEITTSWKEEGRVEGLVEGLRGGLTTGLRALFGARASGLLEQLQAYDLNALQELERKIVPGVRLEDLQA